MNGRVSVEAGFAKATQVGVRAVEGFRQRATRWPDLRNGEDLEALGLLLDLPAEEGRTPEITGYDITYALLRYLFQTAPYSPMQALAPDIAAVFADAVFGRIYYNPPVREFVFRQDSLDVLLIQSDTSTLLAVTEDTAKLLHEINTAIRTRIQSSEVFLACTMDRFSNPYLWIESRLRKHYFSDNRGFAGLRAYYERRAMDSVSATEAKYF